MYVEGFEQQLRINFQVADVHRPLLSLSKAADMGFRSYLDNEGGWLEDMVSGEFIPIERKGDLYVLNIWVRGVQSEVAQVAALDNGPIVVDPSLPFVGRGS